VEAAAAARAVRFSAAVVASCYTYSSDDSADDTYSKAYFALLTVHEGLPDRPARHKNGYTDAKILHNKIYLFLRQHVAVAVVVAGAVTVVAVAGAPGGADGGAAGVVAAVAALTAAVTGGVEIEVQEISVRRAFRS
jgi:hypothetical protein